MTTPYPDSPEDYLMTQLNRAYKLGQRHQKKEYDFQSENNATLVKSVKQIHEYYTNKFLERELGARIEEIEDIDQSRNVVEEDDGIIWCDSCAMVLETENDKCGCNHLYEQRKTRLAELRQAIKQLSKRGE